MEIITIQNLIKMARKGHYPLFDKNEVVKSLKKSSVPTVLEEKLLKKIVRKMKSFKTFERKKLFIQSLKIQEKELFINHIYSKAHHINESKHTKYN